MYTFENNILCLNTKSMCECTPFFPLYDDPYLDIRVDLATFLHPLLLWSIFGSTVVHITVTGPLDTIFTFDFTLII